jgi:hypothetical protein
MSLQEKWPEIQKTFRSAKTILIASVSPDGFPHVTPISSVHLRDDCTAYYLECFPEGLRRNLEQCDRVEVIALRGGPAFWLRALVKGRFDSLPAIRLRGHAEARRPATQEEQDIWQRKVHAMRWTKGHALLWRHMTQARDIRFDTCDPIRLGAMTEGLWSEPK